MTHRVKYLPLASIKFAAKNPKKHDLDEIQASFTNLGFGEPPLLDERTGRLVAGHGRIEALRALKKAGKKPPHGISNSDKDWLVPVVAGWRSKNDQQAQAYLVASNTLVERGGWDEAGLAQLLGGLADAGSLDGTGWSDRAVQRMVAASTVVKEPKRKKRQGKVWVCSGQLFELGAHRIACGDSTSERDVDRVLEGFKKPICVTDPPYGVGLKYADFDDSEANVASLAKLWFPIAMARCEVVVLTPGVTRQWMYPVPAWVLCWFYSGGPMRSPWGFNCWQPILCYGRDPSLRGGEGARPDAVDLNVPAKVDSVHPCPKPVALWEWLFDRLRIRKTSAVFDPFLGSGTSVICAESVGASCAGIDLSPSYVQATIERWEAMTGKKHKVLR